MTRGKQIVLAVLLAANLIGLGVNFARQREAFRQQARIDQVQADTDRRLINTAKSMAATWAMVNGEQHCGYSAPLATESDLVTLPGVQFQPPLKFGRPVPAAVQ